MISYEGGCLQGKADGVGRLSWYQDSILTSTYQGTFKEGKLEGSVTVRYVDSPLLSFEGEYKGGKKEGPGVYIYSFGKRVECRFADGEQAGDAVMTWKNGKRYTGGVADGLGDGKGVLSFPNGDYYEGEFKGGQRNGKGVYVWSNGDRFEGRYHNDVRDPGGVFTSSNNRNAGEQGGHPMEEPSVRRTGMADRDSMLKLGRELTERLKQFLRYPPIAKKAEMETFIQVKFLIGTDGSVKSCKTVVSEHPDQFKEVCDNVSREILNSKFPVTTEEGEPFEAWVLFPLRFRMK